MTGPWVGERSARAPGTARSRPAFTAVGEITGRQLEVLSLQLRSLTPGRTAWAGLSPGQDRRPLALGAWRFHRRGGSQRPRAWCTR
jgi:hypothetical protein